MRTNLSSQISLNRVSPRYYKVESAVERSVLTRLEKIQTNIFETICSFRKYFFSSVVFHK